MYNLSVGTHIDLARDADNPNLWAVLIVTPLWRRVQDSTYAKGQIFIDSTSSCDATEATQTTVLAATPAGAVPLAIIIHNSQTREGYKLGFNMLKKYNPNCFGGEEVSNSLIPYEFKQLGMMFVLLILTILHLFSRYLKRS